MNPSSFQFTLPDLLRDPSSVTASQVHIHIHMGDPAAPATPAVAASPSRRRSRVFWLPVTGLGLFLVLAGFVGGRWEEASADPAVPSLNIPIAPQEQGFEPRQAARMPAALQRELAMPPTVTPPQDPTSSPASATKPPFGLQN